MSTRWQHLSVFGILEAVCSGGVTKQMKSNCIEDTFAVKIRLTLILPVTEEQHLTPLL